VPSELPTSTRPPRARTAIVALIRKDLKLELRSRELIPAMVLFSISVFVLFHFGLDRGSVEGDLAAGILWVTILFAAILAINRLFVAEREQGGFEALLLAPIDSSALLIAKATVLFIFLCLLELVAIPAFGLLLLSSSLLQSLPELVLTLVLVNVGIATVGTLIGSLTIHGRTRELIVPLMALPMLLPIITAASKLTAPLLLAAGPDSIPGRWLLVIALYDIVFALVALAVSDFLLED
jgi:heme exporter protein B